MARNTHVPESALMIAFREGKEIGWSEAWDKGYAAGYDDAVTHNMIWGAPSDYMRGREDAAAAMGAWLDTLPQDVFDAIRPYFIAALASTFTSEPPF